MVIALLLGCMGCTATVSEEQGELDKDLVVLYTNDVHCSVGDDETPGYSELAAYKNELLADGNYVTLVDCGDAIQGAPIGTMSGGAYITEIMNNIGYDVAIPGNHEFGYGVDNFISLTESVNYPYLSCNFVDSTTGDTILKPYTILEYNGVKVAYIGITTPKTLTETNPTHFMDKDGSFLYGFCQGDGTELYAAVQNAVDAARNEGAQYVVALSHLGTEYVYSPYMSTDVITNTSGIDVMLDGHSHSVIECERVKNKDGKRVLLSSTGSHFNSVGMLCISMDGNISTGLIKDNTTKDSATTEFIKGINDKLSGKLSEVVGKTSVDLVVNDPATDVRIVRTAETNLGDFVADAYRAATGADIAIVNGGGVRAEIPAGDITYEQIINVNPFGNMLCVAEVSGSTLLDALEMSCHAVPSEFGGFIQVSGMSFEFNADIPSSVQLDENGMFASVGGERRVKNVKVGDEPLDADKLYSVAGINYTIKSFGDGYSMFSDSKILYDEVIIDNQALIDYINNTLNGVVGEEYADPYGQGRIVSVR